MRAALVAISIVIAADALAALPDGLTYFFGSRVPPRVEEFALRTAALEFAHRGSSYEAVVAGLKGRGICAKDSNPSGCFPPCVAGDRSPLLCDFRHPRTAENGSQPNFTVEYIFNNDNQLTDIVVTRWYFDLAGSYSTARTAPSKEPLKNGLGVGSTVRQLNAVYGSPAIYEGNWVAADWPLSLQYGGLNSKDSVCVGLDIGLVSRAHLKSMERDPSALLDMKVGLVFDCEY